ncbi:acetyltransferase domain-containing protein [Xylaria telfairii]|nr:acetyltransferase domain-containing protein [Xylaria telfairii]
MASPSLPEPAQGSPPASSKIKVKTTWPTIPPNIDRTPIRTERLLLRPYTAADAEKIHEIRQQPEVMIWTAAGVVDERIDESQVFVERFLPPKDLNTYSFAIVYLGDAGENKDEKGVVIGTAGAHKVHPDSGWPEVGYMFRHEYWSKGLASEFLRAFTKAWWALPRSEIELEVDAASVKGKGENDGGVVEVREALFACILGTNIGSRRVLEKNGFKEYKRWVEPDSRPAFKGADAELFGFLLEAPDS